MKERKQTALITGATSGFGYEFAKRFAADGYNLVLVARRQEKLAEIARELRDTHDIFVKVIALDLSKKKSPKEVFEKLQVADIKIDVLVNNAGFGGFGKFWERDLAEEVHMIHLNIRALVELTHYCIPGMQERKSGKILNVASTAGFLSGPLMANYYATKNYVLSFSEALAEELKGTGVSVTILCPGPSKTGFQKRSGVENSKIFQGNLMSPATIVDEAYLGLQENKLLIIPGRKNRFFINLPRFLPRRWVTKLVGLVQREKK
jgi:hypothetical protein